MPLLYVRAAARRSRPSRIHVRRVDPTSAVFRRLYERTVDPPAVFEHGRGQAARVLGYFSTTLRVQIVPLGCLSESSWCLAVKPIVSDGVGCSRLADQSLPWRRTLMLAPSAGGGTTIAFTSWNGWMPCAASH